MAKAGKLTKLKSVLKRLPSFNTKSSNTSSSSSRHVAAVSDNLRPVYVGQSRRRYLISSDVIDHPLFKELAERSSSSNNNNNYDDDDESCDQRAASSINVSCEVVLFEHLLWMLGNADPQPESLEELVEFYSC
ncbi:hypothetical protein ACFE04_012966 [Oxalis oulophora]